MRRTLVLSGTLFFAVASVATTASASPNYPDEVKTRLGLANVPDCTLCHQTLAGGKGTATQLFGQAVRAHGAVAADANSLDSALDAMTADGTDQDRDCVPDITELKNGKNPDNPNDNPGACGDGGPAPLPGGGAPIVPEYGCATSTPRGDGAGLLGAAFVAFALLRLRRRARR